MQDQATTGTPDGHVSSPGGVPFAERARMLAEAAEALAAGIKAFHADLHAADSEPVRQAGFRCDTAVGEAKNIGDELRKTADDLNRIAEASASGTCSIPWGVCPVHGNTLQSSGGRSWCSRPGCGRSWNYDRAWLPCAERAAFTLGDNSGATAPVCTGHAIDARRNLQGARLTALRSTGHRGAGAHR